MKQTRALYARANTIIHKFSAASLSTKLLLFKAYCTPLYGCQLWCSMFQYSYRKFVSLTLRIMMLSDNCYTYNNVDGVVHLNSLCLIMCLHFLLICVSSCIHCIARSKSLTSDNVLVQTALNCDMCTVSPLFHRWRIYIYLLF